MYPVRFPSAVTPVIAPFFLIQLRRRSKGRSGRLCPLVTPRPEEYLMSKALLYDSTVCIGCKQCEQACATQNGLSYDDGIAGEEYQSAHKLTCVLTRGDKFMRRLCMNCEDPSCASVCPVGALKKTALGPVTYDPSKCMGCRYCMVACPFSVPKYEWGKLFPKVQKCVMCPDRVALGKADRMRRDLSYGCHQIR